MYFFFFKQKTAYEIRISLVGSEMCIRDSRKETHTQSPHDGSSFYRFKPPLLSCNFKTNFVTLQT